jgi:hypothetical protein
LEIETVDEFRFELAVTSFTFASTCLRFCSNPLGAFTQVFEMHLETSFACCNAVYYASRVEKITLFKSRISDTVLSAMILTNVVYALTAASGVKKIVTNPLNAHYTAMLIGVHQYLVFGIYIFY